MSFQWVGYEGLPTLRRTTPRRTTPGRATPKGLPPEGLHPLEGLSTALEGLPPKRTTPSQKDYPQKGYTSWKDYPLERLPPEGLHPLEGQAPEGLHPWKTIPLEGLPPLEGLHPPPLEMTMGYGKRSARTLLACFLVVCKISLPNRLSQSM